MNSRKRVENYVSKFNLDINIDQTDDNTISNMIELIDNEYIPETEEYAGNFIYYIAKNHNNYYIKKAERT